MNNHKDLLEVLKRLKDAVCNEKICKDSIECKLLHHDSGIDSVNELFEIVKSDLTDGKSVIDMARSLDVKVVEMALKDIESLDASKDVENFLKALKEVCYSLTEYPNREAKVNLVLYKIFEIGEENKNFTTKEKREIAELLAYCIEPIREYIKKIYYMFRTRLDCSILQHRSALQFIVKNYAKFPLGDSTLLNELERLDVWESIELLDEIIEDCCDLSDPDEGGSNVESAGAYCMPLSHMWWKHKTNKEKPSKDYFMT